MSDRRNPYLILGIDYGAGADEAAVAFARLSRRLRRDASGTFSLEDATWALNQIEKMEQDPSARVDVFRVPADTRAYLDDRVGGLLDSEPINLERRTERTGEGMRSLHAAAIAEVAPQVLYDQLIEPLFAAFDDPKPASSAAATSDAAAGRPGSSRFSNRRLVITGIAAVVIAAAAGLVFLAMAASSENDSSGVRLGTPVAIVNGEVIRQSTLDELIAVVQSSDDPVLAAQFEPEPGVFPAEYAAQIVTVLIQDRILAQAVEELGLEVTDEDLAVAAAQGGSSGFDEIDELSVRVTANAIAVGDIGPYFVGADVDVDPRYGVWDPARAEVIPPAFADALG